MIYGKLIDGELRGAPRPIKTADGDVFTNDPSIYLANGYKPINLTDISDLTAQCEAVVSMYCDIYPGEKGADGDGNRNNAGVDGAAAVGKRRSDPRATGDGTTSDWRRGR